MASLSGNHKKARSVIVHWRLSAEANRRYLAEAERQSQKTGATIRCQAIAHQLAMEHLPPPPEPPTPKTKPPKARKRNRKKPGKQAS